VLTQYSLHQFTNVRFFVRVKHSNRTSKYKFRSKCVYWPLVHFSYCNCNWVWESNTFQGTPIRPSCCGRSNFKSSHGDWVLTGFSWVSSASGTTSL